MLSLKKHVDDLNIQDRLMAQLEAAYRSALVGIAESLPAVSPEVVEECRRQIRALGDQFERQPTVDALSQSWQKLRQQLREFGVQADKILDAKERQFREILRSFADAATTLANQSQTNDGRLTGFTRNLDAVIGLQDLSEMRKRLVKEVAGMKQAVAEMHEASQRSVKQLRAELNEFQLKLAYTEEMAHTDSLTGLCNRRSAEQALRSAIHRGKTFAVVLMDLNSFKGINDRWGHQAGDLVLKEFASRLGGAVRSADIVCRWGGDEFLVLLPECHLEQAAARSRELRVACDGKYQLAVIGKQISILLRSAHGVAEWQRGERIDQMLHRADEALYQDKRTGYAA
jgi:diguanylate cyclase (GGDEF)-like protein